MNSTRFFHFFYFLTLLFLPTQFGKHFWPDSAIVSGLRIDYLSPTLYMSDILLMCTALFFFWSEKHNITTKKILALFLITLSVLLRVTSVAFPGLFFYGVWKVSECIFFAYATTRVFSHTKKHIAVSMIRVGILFESLLSIIQYVTQGSVGGVLYYLGERAISGVTPGSANASVGGALVLRSYGTFSHPNVLAGYLLIGLIVVWFFSSRISRWYQVSIYITGTIGLMTTLSRVPLLMWGGFLFFQLIRSGIKKRGRAVIIILTLFILSLSPLFPRFMTLSLGDQAYTLRRDLTFASLSIMSDNILFGVGLMHFLPTLPFYYTPAISYGGLQPVHNLFLLVAVENGMVGLLIVLLFLGYLYKGYIKMRHNKKKTTGATGALVLLSICLFLGMFDHYFYTLQQGQLLFAFVIGVCMSQIHFHITKGKK